MAQRVQVVLYDDISGDEIDTDIVESPTLTFAVNGVDYEIDLGAKNRAKFEKEIGKYVEHARRVGGRRRSGSKQTSTQTGREIAQAARLWANERGIKVSARGRVPQEVIERYKAATDK